MLRHTSTRIYSLAIVLAIVTILCGACSREEARESGEPGVGARTARQPNPLRDAYFGDLHVHTRFSSDAFIFNTRSTPDDAYRYGKGEAIEHAGGFQVQLSGEPLDFVAVTDHGEYLGVYSSFTDPEGALSQTSLARTVLGATEAASIREAFQRMRQLRMSGELARELAGWEPAHRSAWQETIAAAERHYAPGEFTTFVGYEYTSAPDSQNLHRNVIFRGRGPDLPFSATDSPNPEDLWAWLDERRAEGIEALAIPHNSNGSNGQMFRLESFDGKPLDAAYADLRMRNEPLVEVTQVKGTSDTHPMLSPNDEWASFEIMQLRIATTIPSDVPGSYAREAYRNGLALEESSGFNPFKFGLIGSSDTHNAAGSFDEESFFSKVGKLDDTPEKRGSVPRTAQPTTGVVATTAPTQPAMGQPYADTYYNLWGASGLAGVWAEENTRESIYDALRRKETFATSGPRIRVRFFAGYDFADDLASEAGAVETAYAGGVPMGADLAARGEDAPRFLVWAMRDPTSAPLQRLQVVKGWVDGGEGRERVFDVACSDGLAPDPATHRCPDNGAAVDLASCSATADRGSAELSRLWSDPTFVPGQRAFYFVRVLENPTCRWSTWDAIRAGVEPNPELPATIQERAWSSPIWYVP
ncbi:MAG TPA: DUF3604 domain-containing protein [Thermoanaerobaculia bacterium]|nr:DUF3604 domain-containing protein [Thermoanaerobaculia bacterium]